MITLLMIGVQMYQIDEEADDTIAIRATELGDEAIIVSLDKDFDQVVGWHYNFSKDSGCITLNKMKVILISICNS